MWYRTKIKCLIFGIGLAVCITGCSKAEKNEALQAGMTAIEQLDYRTALESFEKALVSGADLQLVYRGQGIACLGITQYEEAIEAFQKSLAVANGANNLEFDTNYYLAAAYSKAGKIEEAIGVYSAILELRPKENDARFYRGTLELERGNYEKAVADFDTVLEKAPMDYGLYIDVAGSLMDSGYKDVAREYLETALSKEDKNMTDYDKGRLYYYLEDYNNARDCLERAKDTGTAEAVLFLGRTHEALGDNNYAASVYANYLANDPAHPEIYNQLGLCKMKEGDYTGAMEAFEAGLAIENNGYMQALTLNKIIAYEYQGEFKKASVMMENYLKTYPDDENAVREYEFLKTR